MHAFEDGALHHAVERALACLAQHPVFRPDHHIHRLVAAKTRVHALKFVPAEGNPVIPDHARVENIALADEVRHKGVLRLVINALGVANLLDAAIVHHHNRIRHGERLFLIVRDIYKGNTQFLLHSLELQLHFAAQLEIQRAQRLVQKEHLRLVDQSARNGDALLLPAGKRIHAALFIAIHLHQAQHAVHAGGDFFFQRMAVVHF